jgi:hypothetical protein
VNGHYHEYQKLRGNIIMPGTPWQTTYSEEMNKGVFLLDFGGGKLLDISRIKLNLRIKMSVQKTPAEFAAMKTPDLSCELRIVIQGEYADIEALKVTKQFKEFSKLTHVKIVLVPILNATALKKNVEITTGYYTMLYRSVEQDAALAALYIKLLGDIQ